SLPAQTVDGLVARGGRDPGPRVVRDTVCRPALQRHGEGLLDGFLCEIEVAGDPDQRRDRPPRLLAEQAVDDTVGCVCCDDGYPPGDSNSMIGRISIDPPLAAGILDADSMAWSRLSHSTR